MQNPIPKIRYRLGSLLRSAGLLSPAPKSTSSNLSLPTGDERIYHVHIRKTGGTSLNHIFLGVGAVNSENAYNELGHHLPHCCEWNGYRYVGWNQCLIQEGNYFYAFSHLPYWSLSLPPKTFTLTCFRDPVNRVLSHYWMLRNYVEDSVKHPFLDVEGEWLGDSFDDFLDRIPPEHLKVQLWMFSEKFNIDEAIQRIRNLSYVMFTEQFSDGLKQLEQTLGLSLQYQHRRSSRKGEISPQSIARLREMLADVYTFIGKVKSERNLAV